MKMTLSELKHLTQKQIKEYVLMQRPGIKAPKKWENKTKCLAWAEVTLAEKNVKKTTKKEAVKKTTKKEAVKKTTKKEAVKKTTKKALYEGQKRRLLMVEKLRSEPCTAEELASFFGVNYKSVLDDVHAIRHGRGKLLETPLLQDDEVLTAVRVGRNKVYGISKKKNEEKFQKQISETITI